MATEIKLSVTCDRCKRAETRDTPEAGTTAKDPQFDATIVASTGKALSVTFDDLCGPCLNTVANHLAAIEKKVEKKSPDRKGAKK